MSYKSPISVEFSDEIVNRINEGVVRVVCKNHVNVDENELIKALDYDRGQYQKGMWDMFEIISSVWYGKQMYFLETSGLVYSRVTSKTMQQNEAIDEFLERIEG